MCSHLHKPYFQFLRMHEIRPEGWLLNQLKIQASGLSGNLDKFWPDIKDSKWIGGEADGWERVPYWLDGFIPLAWLLENDDMKTRVKHYINYILTHQEPDGWLCPKISDSRSRYDMWGLFIILKVLVVYYDATEDERVEIAVYKALRSLDRHIDASTLYNWAQARWFECLIPIWWLYERRPEEWLLRLAIKLQCQGFDWLSFFENWSYKAPDTRGRWGLMSHVVNNAMMLKSGALLWRMTGDEKHLHSAETAVELLDKFHGMVTGVFTGDECLAGNSPIQGIEVCAVVEYMYSLEHLLSLTGRVHWGDRLEKIAFNALPAPFTPDMWAHQYNQQVNQVQCSRQKKPVFLTNSGEASIFGLEPNCGCCTANFGQAWPKLTQSAFMRSSDGLVAAVYVPCSVHTRINNIGVHITVITDYPFRDTVTFKVRSESPTKFSLWLRVPEWTKDATVALEEKLIPLKTGVFHRLERSWHEETVLTLHFPMKPKLIQRPNDLYSITRGPLIYSLPISERWERINQDLPLREFPHCDYEASPWNYGLCLDPANPGEGMGLDELPIGDCPFSPEGAPVKMHVCGKRVAWDMENGAVTPAPGMETISDNIEELTLIPYGCTNLRITEMPIV